MANANEIIVPRSQTLVASGNGWQVAWGVLLIICGILAVAMPGVAALATALVFAWLLIFGGGCEMAYAIQTRDKEGFGWKLASGVLTLVLGIAILVLPLAGVASLALLVGAFLLAIGGWRPRSSSPRRGNGRGARDQRPLNTAEPVLDGSVR